MKRLIAILLACMLICLTAAGAISEESETVGAKTAKVKLSKCTVKVKDQTYTYTGAAIKPAVTVKYGKTKLKKGTDYTVSYKNNVDAGTATVKVKGKGKYTGSKKVTFTIEPAKLSECTVKLKHLFYAYTGKAVKATAAVKYGDLKLKKRRDFVVAYKNNTEIGVAYLGLKGKGNYTGIVKVRFYIRPQKVTGLKVAPGTGQLTVSWEQDKNVTGYQIQYSQNEDFSSSVQKYTNGNTVVKRTITDLDVNTTYYVRIRSYVRKNGTGVFSEWSNAVKAKTK